MPLRQEGILPFEQKHCPGKLLRSAFVGKQNDKPGYVVNGHLSSPAVAGRLKRPT